MCYVAFCIQVDAWNDRDRHKLAERRRLWNVNHNGPAVTLQGAMRRKWQSPISQNNNRTQITREKRRKWKSADKTTMNIPNKVIASRDNLMDVTE